MSLGYSPEITEKAALSKAHGDKTGYVTIRKTGPRPAVLKNIASEIVKIRQKEAQAQATEQKKR